MEVSGQIHLYQSDLIDSSVFWHGFPERTGGISTGERLSLNLGHRWGDDPPNIQRNRELVAEHGGFAFSDLLVTKHVHGTKVWTVGDLLPDLPEFDGLVRSTCAGLSANTPASSMSADLIRGGGRPSRAASRTTTLWPPGPSSLGRFWEGCTMTIDERPGDVF
jgi:hypothetical protein